MNTGCAGGCGAGVVVLVSAGGAASFFLHANAPVATTAAMASHPRPAIGMVTELLLWNPEHLARMDEVGIGDLVPVGVEDSFPRARLPVLPFRDLRKAVAFHHRIGPLLVGTGGRRGAAALNIREIGQGLIGFGHAASSAANGVFGPATHQDAM